MQPPTFRIPLGALVPVLAIAVSLIILLSASRAQLIGGAAALAVGAIVFFLNDRMTGGPSRRKTISHESSVTPDRVSP